VPRASREMFSQILNSQEMDTDYMIQCSMLEIYKETLNDLLSFDKQDLKIIETP